MDYYIVPHIWTIMYNTPRSSLESLLAHVGTTISGGNERLYTMNNERINFI